ncbi:MAG: carboxypeptidase-like regulatory domain-containing protein, partial [Terracidiphilus sp.]
MMSRRALCSIVLVSALFLIPARFAFAQLDQGTITGIVQDQTGAVVSGASVTLTNVDEGSVLKTRSDHSGIYVFSPIKIGSYSVSASAPGFATTTQTNLHLNIQQRLNVVIALKAGTTTETITVTTEEPLMQTQESSVGQTMDSQQINSIPLNGRNWLYVAQLAAGADPPEGSRGQGKGDFDANGQRAEENNFILDGIDNNANVVDFYNGASYVVQPPPDALAEMKVQTSDYSAEFGHSAGAVVNASIKSGTNNLHGSAWEYIRNTAFDIHDWDAEELPVPAYHENQFGATLGGPIFKNKLFLFGDAQANRIRYAETTTETVPDAQEKAGDFSEILNSNLTGNAPVQLYYQSPNAAPVAITNNCLVTSQYCTASQGLGISLNPTAQKMLSYYPTAGGNSNASAGLLYNNFTEERPVVDDTFQWDVRMDWNIGSKDTAYSRHSYWNEVGLHIAPLGDILDGGGFGDDGPQKDMGQSFMTSETHVFSQTLTNEARVGFTYLHTGFEQPNSADL